MVLPQITFKPRFEVKIVLLFMLTFSAFMFFGFEHLSFDEASQQALQDKSELAKDELASLIRSQNKFLTQGLTRCEHLLDSNAEKFAIVVEIGANGNVARTWRRGDSSFEICMQRLIKEYFYFRHIDQSFFTSFSRGV